MSVAAVSQIVVLAGCVPAVMAPSVVATPGPYRSPTDFAADHAACAAQANQQLAPAVAAANNQVAGTAMLNMMTGTGANAVDVNTQATATLQQQYDADYGACMYAKGDNVPGYYQQPIYYAEPTPTEPTRKRVAHRRSPKKAASTVSPGQAANSGFVVPTPTAASAGGSGFVEPAPAATSAAGAGAGFVQPAPSSMH
jgi:hypothetical protein